MAQYLISEGKQKTVHWQKRGETCEARESVAICNNRVVEGVSPKPPDGNAPPLSETVRSTGKRSDMSPPLIGKFYYGF